MTALIVGTVIALLAVGFVLVPLFTDGESSPARPVVPPPGPESDRGDSIGALRDIESDRATGKLSDADYATLKARHTADALEAMHASDQQAVSAHALDLAEEAILRHRRRMASCEVCGPRPEPNALYCSTCGRYLPGRCSGCGAAVSEPAARICPACGKTLAV